MTSSTTKWEVRVHPANLKIATVFSPLLKQLPKCEGGRWYTDVDTAMNIAAAPDLLAENERLKREKAELLCIINEAVKSKGAWREAIVELEDHCSEPVRLRNMLAAADQLDRWAESARDAIARATAPEPAGEQS